MAVSSATGRTRGLRRAENDANEAPLTAKNLDAAEIDFVSTCGLTPERASALRTELDRNKVVSVETSIDDAVAAFWH